MPDLVGLVRVVGVGCARITHFRVLCRIGVITSKTAHASLVVVVLDVAGPAALVHAQLGRPRSSERHAEGPRLPDRRRPRRSEWHAEGPSLAADETLRNCVETHVSHEHVGREGERSVASCDLVA